MTEAIQDAKLTEQQKNDLDKIILNMLNEVNTKLTHLGINNFTRLQNEIAKILVPLLEEKLN